VDKLVNKSYDKEQYFLDNKRKMVDDVNNSNPKWNCTLKSEFKEGMTALRADNK
jgi:hypothetical protein